MHPILIFFGLIILALLLGEQQHVKIKSRKAARARAMQRMEERRKELKKEHRVLVQQGHRAAGQKRPRPEPSFQPAKAESDELDAVSFGSLQDGINRMAHFDLFREGYSPCCLFPSVQQNTINFCIPYKLRSESVMSAREEQAAPWQRVPDWERKFQYMLVHIHLQDNFRRDSFRRAPATCFTADDIASLNLRCARQEGANEHRDWLKLQQIGAQQMGHLTGEQNNSKGAQGTPAEWQNRAPGLCSEILDVLNEEEFREAVLFYSRVCKPRPHEQLQLRTWRKQSEQWFSKTRKQRKVARNIEQAIRQQQMRAPPT